MVPKPPSIEVRASLTDIIIITCEAECDVTRQNFKYRLPVIAQYSQMYSMFLLFMVAFSERDRCMVGYFIMYSNYNSFYFNTECVLTLVSTYCLQKATFYREI